MDKKKAIIISGFPDIGKFTNYTLLKLNFKIK